MKLVPTVILVEQKVLDVLVKMASLDEVGEEVEPLREMMRENGWTPEMLLGGMMLTNAIADELSGTGLNQPLIEDAPKSKLHVVGGNK